MARAKAKARRRWLAAALVLVLVLAAAGWWQAGRWTPPRARFPLQGALIGAADGAVEWRLLRAQGADFVYLVAASGARRDPRFGANLAAARERGFEVGALHRYDPCAPAEAQAAAFVTTVPRDPALLAPAVALDYDETTCAEPPGEAAMHSELTLFLNQVEKHTGHPALLKLSPAFEDRYHVSGVFERNLWIDGDWIEPGYAGRPWMLWTANSRLRSDAVEGPLRWVVVQP